MNMRITVYDKHNWVIEEELEAGKVMTHGVAAGKVTKGGWRAVGYYPTLEHAALAMLDKAASAQIRDGGLEILNAVRAAKAEVYMAISKLNEPAEAQA